MATPTPEPKLTAPDMLDNLSNPFNSLPIEITQRIATSIEYDTDLCIFRLLCRSTHDAVEGDNCSFWRRRFLHCFEKPVGEWKGAEGNLIFKKNYQSRRRALKKGAEFKSGEDGLEKGCLLMLRDLVVGALSDKKADDEMYESENLAHIKTFVISHHTLLEIFAPPKSPAGIKRRCRSGDNPPPSPSILMRTIQVLCAPIILSLQLNLETYGFKTSQSIVYSAADICPIFHGCHGLDVNMNFVLHNINFWKYHMTRPAEATLHQSFEDLEDDERPRWWDSQLKQGVKKLGKHWKGSYAYIDREDIRAMREGHTDDEQIQDMFLGEDSDCKFQDLKLEIVEENIEWPELFEHHLHARTSPVSRAKTRAQKSSGSPDTVAGLKPQSFHFVGEGMDVAEDFVAKGWLNPLPPQEKVPGWQRMTMMKYFEFEDGSMDVDALWAYEGVVLPGGQIIVGRWWAPVTNTDEAMYSGPFILWCVDGPQYEEV